MGDKNPKKMKKPKQTAKKATAEQVVMPEPDLIKKIKKVK